MIAKKICSVLYVGPAANGSETRVPVIYIMLTDDDHAFNNQWFYAAEEAKTEMLAVALMARSLQCKVRVELDLPNSAGTPYTTIYNMYLAEPL